MIQAGFVKDDLDYKNQGFLYLYISVRCNFHCPDYCFLQIFRSSAAICNYKVVQRTKIFVEKLMKYRVKGAAH
jgi:hypothetical protein